MLYVIAVLLLVIVALQINAAMIQTNHGKFFLHASGLFVDRVDRVEQAVREIQAFGQKDIVDRLERIEAAVNPMARARLDVARVAKEVAAELLEDDYAGYADYRVDKIREQIERGERPNLEDWTTFIRTPYPWA